MSQFPSGSQRGRDRYDGRGGGRGYGGSSGQGYGNHGDRGGNDHGYSGRGDGYGRGGGGGPYDGGRSAGRGHTPGYGDGGDGYGRGSGGSGYSRGSGRGYGRNDYGSNNQQFQSNRRGRGRNTYLAPDLHQANYGQITDGMARVDITGGDGAQMQTCSSTGSTKYPPRPAQLGQIGQICTVRTNHFLIQLSPSIQYVHHYNVTIEPEARRERNREVIKQLLESYSSSFRNLLLAYDGQKGLYAASPLPPSPKEFKVTVLTNTGRQTEYTVAISLAAVVYMQNSPEVIQPLDIILRQTPISMYTPVKQSFCYPSFGTQRLGGGLIAWKGFYQSVRQTQMGLSLNFDSSSAVFVEDLEVIEFVRQLLQNNGPPNRPLPPNRPPSRNEYIKVKKALKNLRVEVTHRGNIRRKYTISGLTSKRTDELTFPCGEDKKDIGVVQYFSETYGRNLKYTAWPCLLAGPKAKEIYLPMEVCKLVHGQKYTKELNNMQTSALLKLNCQHPQQRENDIVEMVRRNDYHNDEYAKEFGIMINEHPTNVQARILPPPRVDYDHHSFRPSGGQWNMMNKKMFIGGTVKSWACINLAYDIVRDDRVRYFCSNLAKMCSNQGMTFNAEPVHPHWNVDPDPNRLKEAMARLDPHVRELDLLIFILPTNSSPLYGLVKWICETKIGLVSQCVLAESVNDQRRNMSILANLPSKINGKVGGTNMVIGGGLPKVGDKPTIIFGADVTHPSPGQDESPSIAAVVASIDWPHATRYIPRYSSQAGGKEIIEDLSRMVRELLHSFAQVNKKPERIIFYRDGASEGQFAQVLEHELKAIKEAWKDEFNESVVPSITFVVVQKRHRTKLFFDDANTHVRKDRSGNVPPGTLVDTMICHPTQFDFYLCSHAGIQGTSRPAHYHVLFDENNFSADDIHTLSNNLCYIYARCTRSVSYPAPTYYAHLVAFRARLYMAADDLQSDISSVSVDDTTLAAEVSIKQVPHLCDNLQNSAIYC